MSVNNIYDTFLSIKITPDTKGRLEEIRDLTEQIIKNRDKINKMGGPSPPPGPPPSPPPPPGTVGAVSSIRRSMEKTPAKAGPRATVHSIIMQNKQLKDLFLNLKEDKIKPSLLEPTSESYRNLKWGTVGKKGGFAGMFEKGMNKIYTTIRTKIKDAIFEGTTETPEFIQAVKDIKVLTAAHKLLVSEIKPIVTRTFGNAKIFRKVLRETGDLVSRTSKLEFNMIDSFGALSTQSLSQISLTNIPGGTTTEENEALERYRKAIKEGSVFDFTPEQTDQIKILNYKFRQSARDPKAGAKSKESFMKYLKTIMGESQFTPDVPIPMALDWELMGGLEGEGLADKDLGNLIKRNTESTGRRLSIMVNKGQAEEWLKMISDADPEVKDYIGNLINESLKRDEAIVLSRNIEGEYTYGGPQRTDVRSGGYMIARDVLEKVDRAYVLTKKIMDINQSLGYEKKEKKYDIWDHVEEIKKDTGKILKWVLKEEVEKKVDEFPEGVKFSTKGGFNL